MSTFAMTTFAMRTFDWILIASGGFDFLVWVAVLGIASLLVSTDGTARIGSGVFALAFVVASGVIFVKAVALMVLGLGLFGSIHLLFIDVAMVAPAVGLLILICRKVRLPRVGQVRFGGLAMCASILAVLLIPICIYAHLIEPFNLRIEESELAIADAEIGDDPITVVVLADLQFNEVTDHEYRAIDLALEAEPDIILIPGDVFQGTKREFIEREAAIRGLLARLDAPGGVFLVGGDCDNLDRLKQAITGTHIKFIDNRIARTTVRGTPVVIAGVELNHYSAPAKAAIRNLAETTSGSDLTILMAHRPGVAMHDDLPAGIDLIVTGHTHGGQVQIPGFGPPITLSSVPRHIAAGGLGQLNGHNIYVSRGVGCERGLAPRIRFGCPPEVSVIRMTGATPSALRLRDVAVEPAEAL